MLISCYKNSYHYLLLPTGPSSTVCMLNVLSHLILTMTPLGIIIINTRREANQLAWGHRANKSCNKNLNTWTRRLHSTPSFQPVLSFTFTLEWLRYAVDPPPWPQPHSAAADTTDPGGSGLHVLIPGHQESQMPGVRFHSGPFFVLITSCDTDPFYANHEII